MRNIALILTSFVVFLVMETSTKLSGQEQALKTNLLYDATTTINLGYEIALDRKMTLDVWLNYNPWTLGHEWVGIDITTPQGTPDLVDSRESKLKHFMIQPELRYWLCEKYNGHFFGVHLHGGAFNVGALKLPFNWGRYKDAEGEYFGQYPVKMVNSAGKTVEGIMYQQGFEHYSGLENKFNEEKAEAEKHYYYADRDGIYVNSFEGWFLGAGVSYGYHWILSTRFSMEFTVGVGYAYLNYEKSRCTDCKQSLEDAVTHYFGPTRAGISLVYMLK